MRNAELPWGHYEEMRPDQLQEIVEAAPVAYLPLGLLEHHGWQLPVGFDGIKAHRLCRRFAARTGGAVLPPMWWGCGGGHGGYKWTMYQPPEASAAILDTTVRRLISFGFRCIVMLAGHYPWRGVIGQVLPAIEEANPDVTFIGGTEADIGAEAVRLRGDHAARWETAYGLALLPELVDMDALRPGRDPQKAWPAEGPVPVEDRLPSGHYDPAEAQFAQHGEDARNADADEANEMLGRLTDHIAARVEAALEPSG